jgi:hypothetical protein
MGRILVVFTASYACHVIAHTLLPLDCDLVVDGGCGGGSDIASLRGALGLPLGEISVRKRLSAQGAARAQRGLSAYFHPDS